ncbi:MAG: HepT-like ribonuclease domain-containing protein [Nanoarchaeota archaeon]
MARRLEIMGEAIRNIPRALKEKNKHVPWFEMSQFRNLTAHSYYEVSLDRIWQTIKKRVPIIKEAINKISLV